MAGLTIMNTGFKKLNKSLQSPFAHPYPPVMDTANYICEEIKKNVKSSFADELIFLTSKYSKIQTSQKQALDKMTPLGRALVLSGPSYSPLAGKVFDKVDGRIQAYNKWEALVAGNMIWNHKSVIIQLQNSQKWACDSTTGLKFMYDIWSNIHYGFVGRFVGFTEFELINGAGYAQICDNKKPLWEWTTAYVVNRFVDIGDADILGGFDDAEDTQAIKVGFSLYNKFGKAAFALTSQDIINEILSFYYNDKPIHVAKCEYHR